MPENFLNNLISRYSLLEIPVSKLVLLAEVLLVILLGQQLAGLTWQLVRRPSETLVASAQISYNRTVLSENHRNPYSGLSNLHLFGEPPELASDQTEEIDPNTVPRSRLGARITGIVASSIPSNSLAIINHRNKDQTYRIGERLAGAEILDIYPDRVIISNNGEHEALLLYPDLSVQAVAERPQANKETSIADVREELLSNPASFTDIVSISPVRRDGKLAGYRINPASRPELFEAAGLQNNDIALSVNGLDLTNPIEAMQLMQSLPELEQASLSIERQGQIYQIDLSL